MRIYVFETTALNGFLFRRGSVYRTDKKTAIQLIKEGKAELFEIRNAETPEGNRAEHKVTRDGDKGK